jgi:polysaccharide pyruvyl transferase WcaK-like protein
MKIGILTYHYSNNYGALLQTFALSRVLRELGHSAIIINRYPDLNSDNSPVKKIKSKINQIIQNQFTRSFSNFRKNHISLSISVTNLEDLEELARNFDAVIVGSDQVWRLEYTKGLGLNNFLDFVPANVKKIAYAASFGKDTFDGDTQTIQEVKLLLDRFNAISVREKSGVELCNGLFNVPADELIDPTMLLNVKDYDAFTNKNKLKLTGKFVTRYLLDPTSQKTNIVDSFAQKYGYNVLNIYRASNRNFSPRNFDFNLGKYFYPSFSKWLTGIKYSDFVITDSFHGAVFSILFNKQFVCIANENRGLTRMTNLLNKFGLTDRLIKNTDDFGKLDLLNDIDYTAINAILSSEREKSFSFLEKSLNS